MNEVVSNLNCVEEKIQQACQRSGRAREDITLIAVSKTKPVSMISDCYQAGIRVFGENKVQELCEKYEELPRDISWHLIGHLQKNKVKYIVDKVSMIHSIDSYELAEMVNREREKKCPLLPPIPILIEVNVAKEETKFGITVDETLPLVEKIAVLPFIRINGLMTIAPFVENPEDNRGIFRLLSKLCVDIRGKNIDNVNMNVLSMGMTNDYEVAIEEGATMIRVGTGIFGVRNYNLTKD